MNYNKHLWLKITNARTAAFTMRPTQKKKDKTRPRVNSGCVASNTRSKTNKTNIGAVNVKNNRKKSKKKLQKKKTCVRKCVQDTNHIDRNGTQNIETKSDLLVVEDACATKKEIPKNSEDGSETTTPVAGISTEKIYKTEKLITKTIDAASDKKPNVRKKEPCGFIYDDSYKNLKIKQLLKIKNKKNALSNRKRLKNTKDPPGDVNNLQNNSKSNGLAEEIEDSVVDKLPNIVIQRNFSKNASGCDSKRRICKVWLTNLPDKQNNSNNSISENFPDNDVIANEIKQPPKNDFESGNSSDSGLKEEKITNIINGFIDYTNLSDVESTTTFSNLSPNSNCALCVEVPNEKNIIQKTDHGSETNPFVKYRLESCNFNIKITRTLQGVSMASASSRVCKKRWTLNHFFKLQTTIIRVTSKDSIFCDAMLEKDDAIKENKVTTKCVLDTENSQTSASSSLHNFLLPLLPPSKRPPTRRSVTITTTKNTEDCNHSKTPPPEDDVISLFACSVVSSPEMDPEYSDDNLDKNVTDSSKNIEENIIAPSTNSNYNIKEIIHSKSNSSPEKHEKEEPMHNRPPLRLMTYNYIPDIFRGVCYHYFAKKNCRRKPYCTRLHGLYPNTEESILNLSYEELQNVYNFTKGKIVYKETFPFFINAYVKHKKILDLVSIVRDAVDQDMFERSPFVEKIVEAIQSIGYSFHQAIEEIITILGITNLNICLSDILINIVVRSSANLEVDWPLIKKLTKYRTDRLDHGVVEDIIRICVKFKNVQLCLNTFRDILNTQLVNLEQLNFEFLQKFVLILRQLNFIQESKILAGKAKIPLNDDDVVNDMNDVSSEKCLKENDVYQLKENVSFKSFSEGEHMYENSYEFDELGANMSYSEAETSTPNCCDTIVPNNGAPSEVSCSSKNISAKVISSLANVIKDKDVSKFLGILEQYKSENYVESFVLNVVKLLEKEDLRDVYKMMAKLFNTISIDKYKHRFWFESHARYLIETLSFNVIALFDRTKSWKQAANIIKRFSNDYVNFTKAKCIKIHKYDYTELGKYLYFCKIFTRAGYLQEAYELLMDPDLRLLNEKTTWTITHHQSFDSGFRDDIVKKFLIQSISTDVDIAKKLILHIIRDTNCIINIDIWQYYNDLLVALMNNQQYNDILDMLDDILKGWNLKMKKDVFRGLLIILLRLPDVDPFKIMTLYVCASKRGFYKLYTGNEKEIILKTDMLYEEIYLILHMFFCKKASCDSLVSDDLCLKLQLPEVVDERPSLLINSNVSINDFRIKIYRVLAAAFYHPVCVEETPEMFSITIAKKQLEILLRFYKNQNTF